MTFAHPAALGLLALAIPIILLHILRPRRQPVVVSSTYLWRELAKPVSAASPWQKLRPSLLLFLQLLAVALLAVAAARPVRATDAPLARHTVFIIDASGSMAARDGQPDRIGEAKARARSLRRQLPAGGVASVVVAANPPRVTISASSDPAAFAEALDALPEPAGTPDYAAAFTLAASLETPGAPAGFVFLSDGHLDEVSKRLLPPGTRYEKMGDRSANRAITLLSVEPRGSGLHALVTLRNTGGPGATQTLRIDVDGTTVVKETVSLPAGKTVEREFDLTGGERVEAFLEGEDLLAADNRAFATAGQRRPLTVLLAGPGNLFLERLLAAIPGVTIETAAAGKPLGGADLAIYDRVAVPADPGGPWLAIAPPGGAPGLTVGAPVDQPALTLVRTDDPLLQGVDLSEVGVATAQRLGPAADDNVLVGSEDTPLLVRGQRQGHPFAYLGFALDDSNLPLQVAFPVLVDRLLADLAGAAATPAGATRAGQPLALPDGTAVTVVRPGGNRTEIPAGGAAPVADRPGFWRLVRDGRPDVVVAVNAEPAESALAPAARLPVEERALAPGERPPGGERSVLAWIVTVLLLVLLAEFLVSRRSRGVPRRQWRAGLAIRAVIVACLVAALVGVTLPRRGGGVATVLLVDSSDSMGAAGREAAVEWTRDALDHLPRGARAGVALFGGDARVEIPVAESVRLGEAAVQVDPSRTDLAGALRLAAALLPSDARRRVVVVSDGRATDGDAAAEARRLRSSGISVDIHAVDGTTGVDTAVSALSAPATVREGESFVIRATVTATEARTVRLTLRRDDQVVEERSVDLQPGENQVEFEQTNAAPGLGRYQLEVASAGDTIAQNNTAFAAVHVEGPAKVLLAEGTPGEAATLAGALEAGGVNVDRIAAADLPALDRLSGYAATILVDVDAHRLSAEQIAALSDVTRDLGRGLVVIGGDQSYALGGYLNSELERLLPVISDVTDPKRRPSVAEVLAIDSSGSMAACHCREDGSSDGMRGGNFSEGGVNKTDISRAAAARAAEALTADDEIGILAFNTEQRFILPLQQLPAQDVVTEGLSKLKPEGGTDLLRPLLASAEALRKSKARLKHIVLFTDGFTGVNALDELVQQATDLAAEGITVSVLATGEGASHELEAVAEAGKGRFYPGRDLAEIPELMAQEVFLASRNFVNEGEYRPAVVGGGAAVRDLKEAPAVLGFLATTAKPTAETQLVVGPERDPLLATWRTGLGRVTAWTSDASARWSQLWAGWDGYPAFWAAVVKDTFPARGASGSSLRATFDGDRLRLTLEAEQAYPAGATAVARVTNPDGSSREVGLERTGAGMFSGVTPAAGTGSYGIGASVAGEDGPLDSAVTLASRSYSPEYQPGETRADDLVRISKLSGGRGAISPEEAFEAADLRAGVGRIPLAGWLLLAAALLWPFDVALRRLTLTRSTATAAPSRSRRIFRHLLAIKPPRTVEGAAEPPAAPEPAAPPEPQAARGPVPPDTVGRLLDRKRRDRDGPPSP